MALAKASTLPVQAFFQSAKTITAIYRIGILEVLYPLFLKHGKPHYIRSDNGSEFIARDLQAWIKKIGIKPIQIYPGSPWENGYNERDLVFQTSANASL